MEKSYNWRNYCIFFVVYLFLHCIVISLKHYLKHSHIKIIFLEKTYWSGCCGICIIKPVNDFTPVFYMKIHPQNIKELKIKGFVTQSHRPPGTLNFVFLCWFPAVTITTNPTATVVVNLGAGAWDDGHPFSFGSHKFCWTPPLIGCLSGQAPPHPCLSITATGSVSKVRTDRLEVRGNGSSH